MWQAVQTYIHLLILRCKMLVGKSQTLELHRTDAGYMLSQSSNQLLPQGIQCGSSIRIHTLVQAVGNVPEGGAFAQIKIRVQLVLTGLHQTLQGDILCFKVQCQPDAF